MRSPLSYLGGKSRLAERIVAQIPEHTCYCEPFCGAAWVLFAKPPSKVEVINDMDSELVTLWRVLQNHLEEFLRYFKFAIISRELFEIEKRKDPATLTDIQRAVRYYYLQRLAFGGMTTGRTFGTGTTRPPGLNISTLEESLIEVHWRLERIYIENLDACECIQRYDRPETFFYIDPPYWGTKGYTVPFKEADYRRLRDVLANIKGKFIMSLNDHPAVRKIFKPFRIRKVSTTYSVQNRRKDKAPSKAQNEVLISNL